MIVGNHGGVHAHGDFAVGIALGDAEQLHHVAETLGHRNVGGRHAADSFVIHIASDDLGSERDRRDDRRLGAGVETFHVGCWVTLGVTETLRFGEGRAVVGALFGHLGEDEVGGAVDDAHHASHRFAAQAFAQRANDRNATGDGGFEQEVDTSRVGGGEQLGAHVGEKFFVGGDHGLAVGQSRGDEFASGFDTADHFDHEVDIGIGHHRMCIAGEETLGQHHVAIAREIAHGHRHNLQTHTRARLDAGGLLFDELHEGGTDVAAPEHAHANDSTLVLHGCHGASGYGRSPHPRPRFPGALPAR